MSQNVADALWTMLADAGVRRCYGIVGDALNPVLDALRRNGRIEFVHVRHEEAGTFAAVAEAEFTQVPTVVCGTAGPGAVHLLNGLVDARREGAPVLALAGDVSTGILDTRGLEEINPYQLFQTASLYTGRIVNPEQTRAVVQTALRTATAAPGPAVIALPGDVAAASAPDGVYQAVTCRPPLLRPSEADLDRLAELLNQARTVTIFGGDGCRDAREEVLRVAELLQAPVGYTLRGKQWLEWENPYGVGMTGLLGWGGCYEAMHRCETCLLLGTGFPFSDFYPSKPEKIQVDSRPAELGRRMHVDFAVTGHVKDTLQGLLPRLRRKTSTRHLKHAAETTAGWRKRMSRYAVRGPKIAAPIRPEYLTSVLDELAEPDAIFTVDTGTPCIWAARFLSAARDRRIFGSFSWASMANAMPGAMGAAFALPGRQVVGLCGDGGVSMLLGDLMTVAAKRLPVKLVVFDNSELNFVHIEMEEAGMRPYQTELSNPDFAKVASAMGVEGFRLEDPAAVRDTVAEFLATPGPALLDAVVDPRALSLPPHVSFGVAEGFALSMAKQALHGDLDDVIHTATRNARLL